MELPTGMDARTAWGIVDWLAAEAQQRRLGARLSCVEAARILAENLTAAGVARPAVRRPTTQEIQDMADRLRRPHAPSNHPCTSVPPEGEARLEACNGLLLLLLTVYGDRWLVGSHETDYQRVRRFRDDLTALLGDTPSQPAPPVGQTPIAPSKTAPPRRAKPSGGSAGRAAGKTGRKTGRKTR